MPIVDPERRRVALEAIVAGERKQIDIAREFGVTRQAVSSWVKNFKERGKVVGAKRPGMRFTDAEMSELQGIVENQVPSDFDIESEDDRWHWLELYDLLLERTQRRFSRSECMKLLTGWGVPDPNVSKKRAAAHRGHEHEPVSPEDSVEFMELLASARERMEQDKAQAQPPAAPPSPKDTKQRAKRIEKQRRRQKLAQKQKRKQRKHKR